MRYIWRDQYFDWVYSSKLATSHNRIASPWPRPYVRWHDVFQGNHRAHAKKVHAQWLQIFAAHLSRIRGLVSWHQKQRTTTKPYILGKLFEEGTHRDKRTSATEGWRSPEDSNQTGNERVWTKPGRKCAESDDERFESAARQTEESTRWNREPG